MAVRENAKCYNGRDGGVSACESARSFLRWTTRRALEITTLLGETPKVTYAFVRDPTLIGTARELLRARSIDLLSGK